MRSVRVWTVLLLIAAVAGLTAYLHYRPFNSERWKSAGIRERNAMLGPLQRSHKFVGMTRAEIVDLLGDPFIGNMYVTDDGSDYETVVFDYNGSGVCTAARFDFATPWLDTIMSYLPRLSAD